MNNDYIERIMRNEERLTMLEENVRLQGEASANRHNRLEAALLEVVAEQRSTNNKLGELIDELKEPMEEFRVRKYGMLYVKNSFSNVKTYSIIVIGCFGVLILMNLTTVLKIFGLMP